jgi:glycosyltransferase involved in cell wall biosynthesis
MRVVYYLPSLYIAGGLERVITGKANYLADQLGYEVTILTSEQQEREICYPLSPRVRHHDLGVVIDNPKQRSLLLKILTYPVKYVQFKKRFSAFLIDTKPISTLRRESNFIHTIPDGSIKIGELHITRNAHSILSNKIRKYLKPIHHYLNRRFVNKLKRFDKIILLTKEEQEMWPELNNTVVIPNYQDMECETPAALKHKRVIAVGRYTYQKGFDLLAEAWSIVAKRHPDWSLHIYGEGDRTGLEKRINELNLTKSFIANGKTDAIIEKYLESAIFVLSSRYEGFGMVLTEAMNCGVPPVSFACPTGPRDIISHGVDGLLVENGNIKQLAEMICYLIENEDVRKWMGGNARESVERFKKEVIMSQWQNFFEDLMKQPLSWEHHQL